MTNNKQVLIALGNRFRGDDGAGPIVADLLRKRTIPCEINEGPEDALAIIGAWDETFLSIVVDATITGKPPGTIQRIEVGESVLPKDIARCSSHGLGVAEAVELSKVMGRMPTHLIIYAIEAKSFEPGTTLSPEVLSATETVANQIEMELTTLSERNGA